MKYDSYQKYVNIGYFICYECDRFIILRDLQLKKLFLCLEKAICAINITNSYKNHIWSIIEIT